MSETAAIATTGKTTARFNVKRPKVPPFARFRGTSAFRISRVRAREYARFLKAQKQEHTQDHKQA